jgi:hypothetical protein
MLQRGFLMANEQGGGVDATTSVNSTADLDNFTNNYLGKMVYSYQDDEYMYYASNEGARYTETNVSKEDKVKIERNKKIILSTTKSAGAGEDIGGLKVTVVLAEPFKSEVLARQTLGRTRDPNTLYIELVDMGFNAIRKYYYYKLPVFNTYASSTSDTTLEAYELNRRNEKIIEKRQNKNIETLAPRIITPIYFRDERFFDYSKEDAELNRKPDIAHPIDPFEWFAS